MTTPLLSNRKTSVLILLSLSTLERGGTVTARARPAPYPVGAVIRLNCRPRKFWLSDFIIFRIWKYCFKT